MKLTAQLKLQPTPKQHKLLKATLETANAACNHISEYAWKNKVFNQFTLHAALYYEVRTKFKLGAQVAIRCLGKVADSYKLDKDSQRFFKEHGSLAYDLHILTYYTDQRKASVWTLAGRERMPYECGERQQVLLKYQKGESDLCYHRGEWYLLATCEVPEEPPEDVDKFLGIDRGIVNIATDSEGQVFQGSALEAKRQQYKAINIALQRRGTKSSRKHLRRLAGRQSRFQKDVNHCISKQLVQKAKRTKQGIALEDLKGINLRTRVRHSDRAKRGNWSFDQLGLYISYKARLYRVKVKFVDPAYTSQRCSVCGHTEKANRRSQAEFLCQSCGLSALADVNAALNIAWVAVNQPIVSTSSKDRGSVGDKPPAFAGRS